MSNPADAARPSVGLAIANNLSILFFVLAALSLVGVAVTDDWPGTNPFGPFLFLFGNAGELAALGGVGTPRASGRQARGDRRARRRG